MHKALVIKFTNTFRIHNYKTLSFNYLLRYANTISIGFKLTLNCESLIMQNEIFSDMSN